MKDIIPKNVLDLVKGYSNEINEELIEYVYDIYKYDNNLIRHNEQDVRSIHNNLIHMNIKEAIEYLSEFDEDWIFDEHYNLDEDLYQLVLTKERPETDYEYAKRLYFNIFIPAKWKLEDLKEKRKSLLERQKELKKELKELKKQLNQNE